VHELRVAREGVRERAVRRRMQSEHLRGVLSGEPVRGRRSGVRVRLGRRGVRRLHGAPWELRFAFVSLRERSATHLNPRVDSATNVGCETPRRSR
jgi:hypothetical protein